MWDLICGKRFPYYQGDVEWVSRPLSWNIDDLRGMQRDFQTLLGGALVEGRPPNTGHGGDGASEWVQVDLNEPHPFECGSVRFKVTTQDSGLTGEEWQKKFLDIYLECGPQATTFMAQGGASGTESVRQLTSAIVTRARNARGHTVPPHRVAFAASVLTQILLTALLGWVVATWRYLPGVLLAVVLAGSLILRARPSGVGGQRVRQWLANRPQRQWLNLKSDIELASERSQTHRDIKVGLAVAIPLLLLNAVSLYVTWVTRGG